MMHCCGDFGHDIASNIQWLILLGAPAIAYLRRFGGRRG